MLHPPPVMNELFIVNSTMHDHNTRQRHLIHTNGGHTYISYRSFNKVGPRVWNALLINMYVNVPISQFKQKNIRYLRDHSLVIVYPKKCLFQIQFYFIIITFTACILPYLY